MTCHACPPGTASSHLLRHERDVGPARFICPTANTSGGSIQIPLITAASAAKNSLACGLRLPCTGPDP
jgi:hypothetical protein